METLRRIRSHFGLLITVATFGALVGFLAARSIDVSRRVSSAYTPPHLQQAPSVGADLVIEADGGFVIPGVLDHHAIDECCVPPNHCTATGYSEALLRKRSGAT